MECVDKLSDRSYIIDVDGRIQRRNRKFLKPSYNVLRVETPSYEQEPEVPATQQGTAEPPVPNTEDQGGGAMYPLYSGGGAIYPLYPGGGAMYPLHSGEGPCTEDQNQESGQEVGDVAARHQSRSIIVLYLAHFYM